jgi:hypothetical protein
VCFSSGDLVKLREAYLEAGKEEKKFLEKRYGLRAIKQAMEETYSMEWLDAYSKKCPSCSTHIQVIQFAPCKHSCVRPQVTPHDICRASVYRTYFQFSKSLLQRASTN